MAAGYRAVGIATLVADGVEYGLSSVEGEVRSDADLDRLLAETFDEGSNQATEEENIGSWWPPDRVAELSQTDLDARVVARAVARPAYGVGDDENMMLEIVIRREG